eukprot:5685865-Prymnesium_polylepis.1
MASCGWGGGGAPPTPCPVWFQAKSGHGAGHASARVATSRVVGAGAWRVASGEGGAGDVRWA